MDTRDIVEQVLDLEQVDDVQRISGSPLTGAHQLLSMRNAEIGIWEMTEGSMSDVEVDEAFVVLIGRATVEIRTSDGSRSILQLTPGTFCTFSAGMSTRWHVTERLRKLYITGTPT